MGEIVGMAPCKLKSKADLTTRKDIRSKKLKFELRFTFTWEGVVSWSLKCVLA